MKKILFIILFILTALLTGCKNNVLLEYKESKKDQLKEFIVEVNSNGFSYHPDELEKLLLEGISLIEECRNKTEVNNAFIKIELDIRAIILSQSEENTIKSNFSKQYEYGLQNFITTRYYGKYNETIVIFVLTEFTWEKSVDINGFEFSYPYGWLMYAYKDNVFYDLEQFDIILQEGILTDKDIESIYTFHNSWE